MCGRNNGPLPIPLRLPLVTMGNDNHKSPLRRARPSIIAPNYTAVRSPYGPGRERERGVPGRALDPLITPLLAPPTHTTAEEGGQGRQTLTDGELRGLNCRHGNTDGPRPGYRFRFISVTIAPSLRQTKWPTGTLSERLRRSLTGEHRASGLCFLNYGIRYQETNFHHFIAFLDTDYTSLLSTV